MPFSESVWERASESDTIGKRAFIALMTFWVVCGLGLTTVGAALTYDWKFGWGLFFGTFAATIVGTIIAKMSESPIISLLGYTLVSGAFGLMMGPMVAQYTSASLINVVGTTAILSVGLGGIGILYPKSLESWGIYLYGALLALIIGQFSALIFSALGLPVTGAFTWLDWIGVLLFSAYLIFDMNRAMHVSRTIDNSIDCALAVYLDIINLFIRLLSLTGSESD